MRAPDDGVPSRVDHLSERSYPMRALGAEMSSHVVHPATLDDDANDGRNKEKDNDPNFARGNRRSECEENSKKTDENTKKGKRRNR